VYERPRIGGDPCDGSFSETASLQSAGRFCAFFSGPEIPFPGNGDRERQRLGLECRLRRRKSEHLVLPRPLGGATGDFLKEYEKPRIGGIRTTVRSQRRHRCSRQVVSAHFSLAPKSRFPETETARGRDSVRMPVTRRPSYHPSVTRECATHRNGEFSNAYQGIFWLKHCEERSVCHEYW
jgi:hypothetical protein